MRAVYAAAALLTCLSGASAQTVNFVSGAPRTARPEVMKVQIQVQLTTRLAATATSEEQIQALEGLRRSVYEVAAKECGLLGEAFKSDCRMSALNVSNPGMNRGVPGSETTGVHATVTFDLSPKAPAP